MSSPAGPTRHAPHDTQEWQDFYSHSDDLRRFFDHYLRGLDNDWTATPRVRLSVLHPGGENETERAESEFPPARAIERELFLDAATNKLRDHPVAQGSMARYRAADAKGKAVFSIRLDDDLEVVGHPCLRLWVEADGAADMDVFVTLQAVRHGLVTASPIIALPNRAVRRLAALAHAVGIPATRRVFYSRPRRGAAGFASRARHRALDPRTTFSHPSNRTAPGCRFVVEVEIALTPTGIRWRRGDVLRLTVTGVSGMPASAGTSPTPSPNAGEHVLHTGGQHPARLPLPVIPRQS